MVLFLLTVGITSLLLIIFKLFVRWNIDSFQAIVYNYLVCLVIGIIISGETPYSQTHMAAAWFPYVVLLGVLFIIGFSVAAETVRYFGVALTSVVQRMSFVLSAGFAILAYHESFGLVKASGVTLAVFSIALINYKAKRYVQGTAGNLIYILLPVLTWLLGGFVESTLFYLSIEGLSAERELQITTMGFGLAGILGAIALIFMIALGKRRLSLKALWAGVLLGIPNYFSIYLVFLLLKKGFEGSVVFPVLNIAVLSVGTIAGVFLFGETLNRQNIAGVLCALAAITLMSLS